MRKEVLYTLKGLYREDFEIEGYRFGGGEKSACIVGAMRGNEMQQLYICSLLINALKELEAHGSITHNHEILVIPSVNKYSMNVGKRFWAIDNIDINRTFPGDAQGDTTKQIAAAQKEGEQLGLTADELAFYDALTKPQAIKDFYENEELIAITKELAETLRKNKTIDWQKRESARAKMRMLIKKLLKKHKYPPEGMEDAVQTVMTQCELWTDNNDMGDEKVINFRSESTSYDDSDYADSMMVAESATTYGARK